MKKLLAASAVLGFILIWGACNVGTNNSGDFFDIEGDSTWTSCDSLLVELLDDKGMVLDTLFNDSLKNVDQLRHLEADKFDGGKARIHIKGTKGGSACVEQTRAFDGAGGPVVVDTVTDKAAKILSVEFLSHDTVEVSIGGTRFVEARVLPAYADQGIGWKADDETVISVSDEGGAPAKAKISGLKLGVTHLVARSSKDDAKKDDVVVKVVSASLKAISLSRDTVKLFQGGPSDSLKAKVSPPEGSQAVTWKSQDAAIATVDAQGRVQPVKAGQTYVTATSAANSLSASALVIVKLDVPVLTVESKSGAPINVPIAFNPKSIQEFGSIVEFAWDFEGDGDWDGLEKGPYAGDTVNLPAVAHAYPKEGQYQARFRVTDSEGNSDTAEVTLDIGNQAPEITALRHDTLISIRDSISMTASVHDVDGKVAAVSWDFDGDGIEDDSIAVNLASADIVRGHRYADAGTYNAIIRAVDDAGKPRRDTAVIKVVLDPPEANAGADTTVLVNSKVTIHAGGTDKFGSIAKRELKVGASAFVSLSAQDTTFKAPGVDTVLTCVIRVTDDDGQSDVDTVLVTVDLSANADLESLVFSGGALDPVFKSSIAGYAAHVGFADSVVTVTPTVKEPSSHITVNAQAVASGAASAGVKLKVGTNNDAFKVVVTAGDGTQRIYRIDVARDPSAEATLKNLETANFKLQPGFSASAIAYADTVPYADSAVRLKPTAAFVGASLTVNDNAQVSGTYTEPLPLQVGDNTFIIVVTAQDGVSKTTYTVKVNRLAKVYVYRKMGVVTLIDSIQTPLGQGKAVNSPSAGGYRFLNWAVTEGSAAFGDSLANPTPVTPKSGLVKVEADYFRVFTIKVDAGVGGTIKPAGVTVDSGSKQSFSVKPDTGYRLGALFLDKDSVPGFVDTVYTIDPVTANRLLTASFVKQFRVTGSPAANLSPSDTITDTLGTVKVTITPPANNRLKDFTDNDVSVPVIGITKNLDGPSTYTIAGLKAGHNLKATFIPYYSVTAGAPGGNGTATPGQVNIDEGGSQVITLTPATGYYLSELMDGDKSVLANVSGNPIGPTTYTVSGVNAARNIVATFSLRTFQVTVNGANPLICGPGLILAPTEVSTKSTITTSEVSPSIVINCNVLNTCCTAGTATTVTKTTGYGDHWRITTDSLNANGNPFLRWSWTSSAGVAMTSTSRSLVIDPVYGDITYNAVYSIPCGCLRCCILNSPTTTLPATQAVETKTSSPP